MKTEFNLIILSIQTNARTQQKKYNHRLISFLRSSVQLYICADFSEICTNQEADQEEG